MKYLFIIVVAAIVIALLILLTVYICFRMAFYADRKAKKNEEEYPIPEGKIYEPYRQQMVQWMKECRALPQEEIHITSFDGLNLYGKYFEYDPEAPMELMFHGYRGSAERDLCGGVQRCFALGRNVLIVDQRTSGKSEGNVISFGINESRDCMSWLDYVVERWPERKIILTGISMGASTVMIAAGMDLPENVAFVLADCGFTSAKAIIKIVIRMMKLPEHLAYPFVKWAAKIFGHFKLEETSSIEAMTKSKVPVIFFHGEDDDFVPCRMSVENYNACVTKKKLVTIPGAGHGLSYIVEPERYLKELADFSNECGVDTHIIATHSI